MLLSIENCLLQTKCTGKYVFDNTEVGAGLVPARIVRQHDESINALSFCFAKSGQGQALPLL
jgi:hypothetical protein